MLLLPFWCSDAKGGEVDLLGGGNLHGLMPRAWCFFLVFFGLGIIFTASYHELYLCLNSILFVDLGL